MKESEVSKTINALIKEHANRSKRIQIQQKLNSLKNSNFTANLPPTHLLKLKPANVVESLPIVLDVVQLDLEVPLVQLVLVGQDQGVVEVARLTTHPDSRLHVKVHLPVLRL